MLAYEPSDRMDMQTLLNHPWMNGLAASLEEAVALLSQLSPIELEIQVAQNFSAGLNKNLNEIGDLSIENLNKNTSKVIGQMKQPKETSFYSFSTPDSIFNIMHQTIETSLGGTVTQASDKYRMKVQIQQEEDMMEFEINCGVIEQKYCFEFMRISGSAYDFYNAFESVVEELKTANA